LNKKLEDYYSRLNQRLKPKNQKGVVHFTVIEPLCVYGKEHRDYTLNLMRNISGRTVGDFTPIHIDLTNCPKITASASVMLFAEISRARIATENDNIVTISLPQEPELQALLHSIGWVKAINAGCREQNSLFDNNEIFQTLSDPGKAMASLLLSLRNSGITLTSIEAKIFTKGVNEAMLNVLHHAYSHEKHPLGGIGRRWWQCCYTVVKNNEPEKMVYIIFDLGQGILSSLPKDDINESIQAHIIRAMSKGVTCTGEKDRGKGSQNMKDAMSIRENSILFIASNNVVYSKKMAKEPESEESTIPFIGTLVEWQIYI